ncbi:MAG: hypothetical protein LUG16_06945 [Candidatus Gastranaerophilales bacterium]|nr:hypothetical protein [Candidatus Gastranaerophilales bacterium]
MKKRIIISIVLTIIVISVTFNYWFIFSPLTFSMDIKSQSDNPIIITTVLNRKDDPSFSKSYENGSEINLLKTNKYNISFHQKTPPKRLRLILNKIEPNIEYQISNLSFRNGKYPVSDLSKFKSDNAKLVVKDNCLIIISNSDTATLDYSERITARQAKKFDLKIFLILGILSFLLFYKLTSYLADFKINKNVSRLDIVFLSICTAFLFIPMLNINRDTKSVQENRNLAQWKPLFDEDNSINHNFGKDFESWISDRFGIRKLFINLYLKFKISISTRYVYTNESYWDKKTNWMFGQILTKILTDEQVDEISAGLIDFNNFCKSNNIKLYVLICPEKQYLYVQHTFLKKDYFDSYRDSIDKIRQNTEIPIIYPYDELTEAAKEDYVFFKTDHHWTDWGSFIGYKALMKEMKKDYPNIKEVNLKDFNISHNNLLRYEFDREYGNGCTYNLFNIPDKFKDRILDTSYTYFTHKDRKYLKIKIENSSNLRGKFFEFPYGTNLKVLQIGSSSNENLDEIFPYSFKETKYIRINGPKDVPEIDRYKLIKLYEKNILNYNPDIILLCIQVNTISLLKDLTNED